MVQMLIEGMIADKICLRRWPIRNVIENSRTCLLRGVIIFYVGVRKYREETADNKKMLFNVMTQDHCSVR